MFYQAEVAISALPYLNIVKYYASNISALSRYRAILYHIMQVDIYKEIEVTVNIPLYKSYLMYSQSGDYISTTKRDFMRNKKMISCRNSTSPFHYLYDRTYTFGEYADDFYREINYKIKLRDSCLSLRYSIYENFQLKYSAEICLFYGENERIQHANDFRHLKSINENIYSTMAKIVYTPIF